MKHIYLDHSATTPVDRDVLQKMMPYFIKEYGNPSSIHYFGQKAAEAVDNARIKVADFLHCESSEVVFTSGATESNNIALKGLVKGLRKGGSAKMHIITSIIEHPAILEPSAELIKEGVEVTYLSVNKSGLIDLDELKKAIKDNTALVSIMYVNNEVGIIEPIRKVGKLINKINETRERNWQKLGKKERGEKPGRIYFHTDATQALNFVNCDVRWNYIDMLSLSGHKIYGPKGIGALYVRSGIPVRPLMLGGHQENNVRNGTLNVPGIVGLGEAIGKLNLKEVEKNNKKIAYLRDYFVKNILKKIPDAILNTDIASSIASHAHFSFLGVEGESMLIALDMAGISVSTGSACASGSLKPSHVLLAMGIKTEIAHNSLRFTFGKNNTKEEVDIVIRVLPDVIKKLRKISTEYNLS